MMKIKGILFLLFAFVTGCATRPQDPAFTEKTMETKYLSFEIWEKDIRKGEPMRIYIEGDGIRPLKKPSDLNWPKTIRIPISFMYPDLANM